MNMFCFYERPEKVFQSLKEEEILSKNLLEVLITDQILLLEHHLKFTLCLLPSKKV